MNQAELEEKLLARGAKRTHLNSKVIPIMLEILAEDVSPSEALEALQSIRDNNLEKIESERWLFENEKRKVRDEKHDLEVKRAELEETEKRLKECMAMETAEMRDRLKAGLIYERMTRPDKMNIYQYSNYVSGLAIIMGNLPMKEGQE